MKKLLSFLAIFSLSCTNTVNLISTIYTEKEQININNLQLFNKNNEKLSLITLEI
ncbi:hypothetical protein [Spiroplasma sp. ChiS]|uniref:hypothetical protein n=1 Tax=Spiroplasma sp. ChiS TaxID=2099885 RepID=UPI00139235A5|nr:hypothetical protein [Spiroplasma sp. ChiS]